ncbi:enoyl-CoA hydratase/isomerase family protein [Cytobacillus gottheilii]|uniref:enoyl-CoA hydratase/isomerase family protein n=1 Tax=Cytobacillus gottheilii TaxID=859144 RepID=UPI0009BAC590|nr:enoyl-CoA hydratase-related protein [Cytobacillus gottheilii]
MEELYWKKEKRIASIIINRSHKKNAFNLNMFQTLSVLLDEIEHDKEVKVVVLCGADGSAFSAGADISEFLQNRTSAQKAKQYNTIALKAVEKLYHFPKPTIAAIRGLAIGGGLELVLACDFRFASHESLLGITAAKLAIVYNLSSTKRLIDAVGASKAKEMLYTGKLVKAQEGHEIGLVNYVLPYEELLKSAYDYASQLAEKSSLALNGTKKVIQAVLNGDIEEDENIEQLILASFESEDYQEGIQAFLEKRKPNFK